VVLRQLTTPSNYLQPRGGQYSQVKHCGTWFSEPNAFRASCPEDLFVCQSSHPVCPHQQGGPRQEARLDCGAQPQWNSQSSHHGDWGTLPDTGTCSAEQPTAGTRLGKEREGNSHGHAELRPGVSSGGTRADRCNRMTHRKHQSPPFKFSQQTLTQAH
jgi:hypothetical protein